MTSRGTTKRKAALVLSIIKGETSIQEAYPLTAPRVRPLTM